MARQDAVDVPDYDDNANEFAATQAAAASNKNQSGDNPSSSSGSSSGRGRARSKQGKAKDEQHTEADEVDETKREPFTATLRRDLRRRMNGMVHHAQTVGQPRDIASISDYVNEALREKLAKDERKLNNGQPFPEPMSMRTGRPKQR